MPEKRYPPVPPRHSYPDTRTAPHPMQARSSENLSDWFSAEVHPHDSQLKAYLRNSYPKIGDIDDVVQEAYLRIWKRHALSPITSVKNFLFCVARHLAIDQIRRSIVCPVTAVESLSELPVVDETQRTFEAACSNEEIALLLDMIESLPRRCREIMIMRKLEGLSQKEIAARLGISEETVHVQIGRGMRRCEALLRRRYVLPKDNR